MIVVVPIDIDVETELLGTGAEYANNPISWLLGAVNVILHGCCRMTVLYIWTQELFSKTKGAIPEEYLQLYPIVIFMLISEDVLR